MPEMVERLSDRTSPGRWRLSTSYSPAWEARAAALFQLFFSQLYSEGTEYRVAEFGCGVNAPVSKILEGKSNFHVQKFDLKPWDSDTIVLDLNDPDAKLPDSEIFVLSGVLEYLNNADALLIRLMGACRYLLLSYAYLPIKCSRDDEAYLREVSSRCSVHGWRNHYSSTELVKILAGAGVLSGVGSWKQQGLFLVRSHATD